MPFLLAPVLKRLDVTKARLAEDSGIPYAMICRIERGDSNPNWTTVVRIARALGVSTSDFEPRRGKDG